MKTKQVVVIALGAVLVLSATLGAISFSSPPDTITIEELNTEVNGLVDNCMQTLPEGLPECDEQLRDIVTQLCEHEGSLDACTDGRVETYYSTRGI